MTITRSLDNISYHSLIRKLYLLQRQLNVNKPIFQGFHLLSELKIIDFIYFYFYFILFFRLRIRV